MDTFDNFQYDSTSAYGGALTVVDDNSSVYTAGTHDPEPNTDLNLSSLSLSDSNGSHPPPNMHSHDAPVLEEDIYGVLDDLKDESSVDLPPHACR